MLPSLRVHSPPPDLSEGRLEGFLDWAGVVDSEPAKEEEMFSLATGFSIRMRKEPATLESGYL